MAPATKQHASLEQGLKDMNLSPQELNKFEKAFKDPEFLKLFEEYAKEVSDPKVKAETDLYLRQLEEQGRGEDVYGKGVMLVTPKPALVLKSKVMGPKKAVDASAGAADNKRDSLTIGQKVFINVCTSEKVEAYSLKQARDASGRSGQQMSIPLSIGPVRQGTDKQGQPAAVYDIVVHPDTVEFASRSTPVMGSLAETALEQVEKVSFSRLSRGWRRLNTRFKATEACPEPAVQCIRTGEGGQAVEGRLRPRPHVPAVDVPGAISAADVSPLPQPQPQQVAASNAGSSGSAKRGSRSTFSFGRAKGKAGEAALVSGRQSGEAVAENLQIQDPSQPGYRHSDASVTPSWSLVHRGQADLAAAWGDAGRGLVLESGVPKELLLRVSLPEMMTASGVDLDVGGRSVSLKVPGRYRLDVSLPYSVDESKGKAKFDKARKQLEITLPVVPPPPLRPPQLQSPGVGQELLEPPSEHAEAHGSAVAGSLSTPATAAGVITAAGEEAEALVDESLPSVMNVASLEGQLEEQTAASIREAVVVGRGPSMTGTKVGQEATEAVGGRVEVVANRAREDGDKTLMTENERMWTELHTKRLGGEREEDDGMVRNVAVEATTLSFTSTAAPFPALGSGEVVGGVEAVLSAPASGVVSEPEPTVLLQPRLRWDLTLELD